MFSKQQTANATRLFSKTLLASALSFFALTPLSAEDNGAFVEGGFEYSNVTGAMNINTTPTNDDGYTFRANINKFPYDGNLFGADFQIGYKQFFGNKKRFGLRYYGFFSGQGGNTSYQKQQFNNMGNPTYWATINQPSANLFYGVGLDALLNFYEKKNRTFGMFVGVMIGGSSWLMGQSFYQGQCMWKKYDSDGNLIACQTMNQYYSDRETQTNKIGSGGKATFSPTFVQFIVNIGFRTNLSKHQGFEVGVRIPTIDDPYYTVTNTAGGSKGFLPGGIGSKRVLTFRRTVGFFVNYVYNF
ncbi:outer membrane protein [Helicobacter felis]|uniref:outer membrane protein n=1 Tax=Helicobacter felis TaxID=214 RepID=UPI000CF0F675|nr:outer membrane protein [Helicobacter felis]